MTLFLVMMGYIVYFHLMKSDDFIRSPYNQRQDSLADRIERGMILDRNGRVLAETVTGKGKVPEISVWGYVCPCGRIHGKG